MNGAAAASGRGNVPTEAIKIVRSGVFVRAVSTGQLKAVGFDVRIAPDNLSTAEARAAIAAADPKLLIYDIGHNNSNPRARTTMTRDALQQHDVQYARVMMLRTVEAAFKASPQDIMSRLECLQMLMIIFQ